MSALQDEDVFTSTDGRKSATLSTSPVILKQVTTTVHPVLEVVETSITTTTIIASSNATSSTSSGSKSISSVRLVRTSTSDTPTTTSIASAETGTDKLQSTEAPTTTQADVPTEKASAPSTKETTSKTTRKVSKPLTTQISSTTRVDATTTEDIISKSTQTTASQADQTPLAVVVLPGTASVSSEPTSALSSSSSTDSPQPLTTEEDTGPTSTAISVQTTGDTTSEALLHDTTSPPSAAPQPSLTAEISADRALPTALTTDGAGDSGNSSQDSNINAVNHGSSLPSKPVLIGSVVGSVGAVLLVAFMLLFWRRRATTKRRNSFLTPLSIPPAPGSQEKYGIDGVSWGPAARSAKLAAAVSGNAKRFGHKVSVSLSSGSRSSGSRSSGGGSIPMHNWNPRFMEAPPTHSRNLSAPAASGVLGFWGRLRNKNPEKNHYVTRSMSERSRVSHRSGFSDRQFDRDHQPMRMNSHHGGAPFAGGFLDRPPPTRPRRHSDVESLDLDPFSDINAAPRVFSQSADPLSDHNTVKPPIPARRHPSNYVEVHRRGQSLNGQPDFLPRDTNTNRDSPPMHPPLADTFETRRGQIRSDPFDLEVDGAQRPNYSVPMPEHMAADNPNTFSRPFSRFNPADNSSSKYSSGVSSMNEDWDEPVPAVRPLRSRDGVEMDGYVDHEGSNAYAQGSPGVGKAM